MFPIFAGNSAATGYNLTRSLRFRSSASAGLYRTLTAGNQKTWTWSGWVKRGIIGTSTGQSLFDVTDNSTTSSAFYFNTFGVGTTDAIGFQDQASSTQLTTTQVFRDPSSWYHIVLAVDTTQATASNRVKLYVNGNQVTSFTTATYPALNANTTYNQSGFRNSIGMYWTTSYYLDGYLAEVNFIDGQALTPSSFGSTNALTGVWQPAKYTGTYGTNGFYLPFTDNSALTTSSNVGLGKDFSGNGNYWTTNNISITAGVTYDSMTDVPTLTSATAANFAVLNTLDKSSSITTSNGNLAASTSSSASHNLIRSTIAIPSSGKWYAEMSFDQLMTGNPAAAFALIAASASTTSHPVSAGNYSVYGSTLTTLNSGATGGAIVTGMTTGQIWQFAVDADNNQAWIGLNNAWFNVYTSGATTGNPSTLTNPTFTGTMAGLFLGADFVNSSGSINFGQRPFAYTPPTGFVALNTYNLPTSTIVKGNTVMDATLYTGNSSTQTVTNAGAFKPDLVWIKNRSTASQHVLTDSVRGVTKQLFSSLTNAEQTSATGITSLNSNGFSLDTNVSPTGSTNSSPDSYVDWQWQAGQGSTSSNTNGTITSTVSVNASAGFSIVTYTGNGTNGATVGHGLGVKPSLIIEKGRASTYNWPVQGCGVLWPTATQTLFLNNDGSLNAGSAIAAPTSSVFTPAATAYANESGLGYVAYLWTPIAGYSSFGTYTGNGSTDGTFVYTGFKPRFVLFKRTDASGYGWVIHDSARNTYNVVNLTLYPSGSDAESTNQAVDFVSNGFKLRDVSGGVNGSGGTYIYAAFATNPFKQSLAF
jgi:hypothetical protein